MLHSRIEAPRSLLAHLSVTPRLAALIEFDSLRCIGLGRHQDWSGIDGDLEAHTQGMKESAWFSAHPPVHGRNYPPTHRDKWQSIQTRRWRHKLME